MRNLTILGATGSIGTSTLAVVEKNIDAYRVFGLAADTNVDKMLSLSLKWKPRFVAMNNEAAAKTLHLALKAEGSKTQVLAGIEGLSVLASHSDVDCVMAAIVGAAGLLPTMAAVKAGKRVLLANKEALVMSGAFFMNAVHEHGAELIPVDSEHNAIFQCLPPCVQSSLGRCSLEEQGVSSILLTGSGGPFRFTELSALYNVTPSEAISHPNWSMGPKISLDSATMMNKGLEYIEAKWLFNAAPSELDVIIHPQSIVHSMVQYRDGSLLAQMGRPDMCTPIAHALAYPKRIDAGIKPLNFSEISELTFMKPDFKRYPCLKLAIDACAAGQAATTILNAANEVAADAFLTGRIGFMQIAQITESVLQEASFGALTCIEGALEFDFKARILANNWVVRLAP